MKLHGIGGVGTGKLGNMVYSVRNGEQIVRQYNPIVANPSTAAQVEVRSKMKLMSQLAAIVAPVIAINAEGLKTKRNLFISRNYSLAGYEDETAQIDMANVQLTKSNTAFPDFEVDRSSGQSIAIHLSDNAANLFDRVVYCAVISQADGSLRLWDDVLVTEAGVGGLFPAVLPYTPNAICIYGYGVRANSDDAKAAYADLKSGDAGKLAQILTSRNATLEAVTISETKGCVMEIGADTGMTMSSDQANIRVLVEGNGSVTGAGYKLIGSQVILNATPGEGYMFSGWYDESNHLLSSNATYQFVAEESVKIIAKFETIKLRVTLDSNYLQDATLTGAGLYTPGTQVTVTASADAAGFHFDGWKSSASASSYITTERSYTFTIEEDTTLYASYGEHD